MHLSNTFVAFAADAGVESAVALVKRLLGQDQGTRVLVFCAAQGEEHAEPLEQLLALKDRHLDRLSLSFVMDREPDEAELLRGPLDAAKIDALATTLFDAKSVREYHVYGSQQLAVDVNAALGKLGVDKTRIHCAPVRDHARAAHAHSAADAASLQHADHAGRTGDAATAPKAVEAPPKAGETRVSFVMDGRRRSFSMHTNTESILDAAERAGIDLPFSCKAGVCATCRTKLLRGQVEMVENYALEDWELEQGFILACQSHATTPELELTYDEK
ncbi:MAG TPA: 2Fe-2S iron-sulfur cluster-binding protein [Steroidobacteraceae bacterium]|jgi:ring-1,2-phenylacetyl-CoA epoxidase subunit PaaE|nr:2Fe-2S iron-sulfur cluster-binding protein [Steroidobacteraceae bacterium]